MSGPSALWRPPGLPGIGQSAPVSTQPAGLGPSAAGFASAKQLDPPLVLARVNSSGTTRTSVSVAARIVNPTARLICSFGIGFEPDTQQAIGSFPLAVWSATAMRPGGNRGREARFHAIFTSQALPQQYEIASAVRLVLLEATLTIPLTGGAVAIPGNWILSVEWEPAMPMCPEEISALYGRCTAQRSLDPAGDLAP